MSDQFTAEIRLFGFNFAPKGWALCNGVLMNISQNTALFSLLGTMYGGNGQTTFALPNLQERVPMQFGDGPGLMSHSEGEAAGSSTVTLLAHDIPSHNHNLQTVADDADLNTPASNAALAKSSNATMYNPSLANNIGYLNTNTIGFTGGALPHNNMQPFLSLNFCIALEGVYPQRG